MLGVLLRAVRTMAVHVLGALVLFALTALVVERTLVGDDPAVPYPLLAVLYVLLGVVAGVNLGLATALERGSAVLVDRAGSLVSPVVERAVARLAVPKEGIATKRLREVAELGYLGRRRRVDRIVAAFAVRRGVEAAGLSVLRERLLGLADQAESLGHDRVGRELVEAAARDGLTAAVARQLTLGWRANRAVALAAAAVAFASLPVLAAVAL